MCVPTTSSAHLPHFFNELSKVEIVNQEEIIMIALILTSAVVIQDKLTFTLETHRKWLITKKCS